MRIIGGRTRANDCRACRRKTTQDYVRESLFNIIRWDVEDARVLDLFAGTGALAGGSSAAAQEKPCWSIWIVPHARQSVRIWKPHLGEKCRLIARDYHAAIDALAAEGTAFDVVFIDPPL